MALIHHLFEKLLSVDQRAPIQSVSHLSIETLEQRLCNCMLTEVPGPALRFFVQLVSVAGATEPMLRPLLGDSWLPLAASGRFIQVARRIQLGLEISQTLLTFGAGNRLVLLLGHTGGVEFLFYAGQILLELLVVGLLGEIFLCKLFQLSSDLQTLAQPVGLAFS